MAIEFNVESQVKTYATISAFPAIGAVKTIYIALDTKLMYVYDSGAYTSIGDTTSAEWGHINGDITSQVDLQTALNDKFNNPTGDSTQYLDGAGTPTTFPAFASADKMVTVGRNATGSTLYKGTIVYINGSTGNRPNFVKAQANGEMTSAGTFGVIEADIPNNADGNCVTIGTISDLDTRSSAPHPFTSDTLADGDTIYLSPTTAGFITNVKPYAPNHLVYLGKVVRTSPTNGTIVYRVQNGYELDELHDVAAQTPNNNEVLSFESATTLWKPKSITTLLGYTPVPTSRTLTINGTTQDLSADRTFTISTGITIGTTAITSGTVGRVLFEGTGNVVSESANLFWDNTNGYLGSGTSSPLAKIHAIGGQSNTFKAQSTTADMYNQFISTSGTGEFGIYQDSFYFQALTSLSNGIQFLNGTTGVMKFTQTGNLLINTTTDAGFKLDVNGTSVFRGTLGLIASTAIQLAVTTNGNTRILSTNNDIILNAGSSTIEHSFGTYSVRKRMLTIYGDSNANAGVSIGVDAVNVASAILSAESTTKGFLPPRQTQAQRTAIASPAVGLVVFQTDATEGLYVYKSTGWTLLL